MHLLAILEKEARERGADIRKEMEEEHEASQLRNGWYELQAVLFGGALLGLFVQIYGGLKK